MTFVGQLFNAISVLSFRSFSASWYFFMASTFFLLASLTVTSLLFKAYKEDKHTIVVNEHSQNDSLNGITAVSKKAKTHPLKLCHLTLRVLLLMLHTSLLFFKGFFFVLQPFYLLVIQLSIQMAQLFHISNFFVLSILNSNLQFLYLLSLWRFYGKKNIKITKQASLENLGVRLFQFTQAVISSCGLNGTDGLRMSHSIWLSLWLMLLILLDVIATLSFAILVLCLSLHSNEFWWSNSLWSTAISSFKCCTLETLKINEFFVNSQLSYKAYIKNIWSSYKIERELTRWRFLRWLWVYEPVWTSFGLKLYSLDRVWWGIHPKYNLWNMSWGHCGISRKLHHTFLLLWSFYIVYYSTKTGCAYTSLFFMNWQASWKFSNSNMRSILLASTSQL